MRVENPTAVAILPPSRPDRSDEFPQLNVYVPNRPRDPRHFAVWSIAKALERLPGDPVPYGLLVYKTAAIYGIWGEDARSAVDESLLSSPAFVVEPREPAA